MDRKINQKGFSLVEVMIAITLFGFFVTAFLTSQGYNVSDSALSEQQLMLQQLCEQKINQLHLDPPKFENLTDSSKETKPFEEKDYSDYEYTIEIKKLVIPDFAQLFANKGAASEEATESYDGDYLNQTANRNSSLEKLVFEELKKNIEKMIWQVRVTVTNKDTKYNYSLSTWVTNYNERVTLNIGM